MDIFKSQQIFTHAADYAIDLGEVNLLRCGKLMQIDTLINSFKCCVLRIIKKICLS